MGDGIGVELLFEDHMSGPAAQIRSQILGMRSELIQLKEMRLDAKMREDADAMKSLGNDIAKMGLEAQKAKIELDRLQAAEPAHKTASGKVDPGFLSDLNSNLFGTITAANLAATAIIDIAHGVEGFVRGVADAGIEVAKFAIEASEMRENATTAFEVLTGSADAGAALYKQIEAVAVGGHIAIGRAQTMAQTLMAEGVKQADTVAATVQAIGALERVGPQGSAERLQKIIARSMASGHFEVQARTLAGVANLPDLMSDISKRLHQPVATIEAEMKAGKIAADVGIAAIVDAVNWGKIGDIAQKRLTLKDVWTDFGNAFTRMLDDINVTPIIQAFENIIYVINGGENGVNDFKDSMRSAMDNIASWVGDTMIDVLGWLLDLEYELIVNRPMIEKYWAEFKKGVASINWHELIPSIKGVADAIMLIGAAIAKIAEYHWVIVDIMKLAALPAAPLVLVNRAVQAAMPQRPDGTLAPDNPTPITPMPGHADGGTVLQPAPGEVLASVAPGEVIVPRGSAPGGGGGKTVHVGGVQIHLTVQGHLDKDVQRQIESLSTHALEDAFERVALELATEAA